MNKITEELLRQISDFDGELTGAYNIRVDGECDSRQSTEHVRIESKIMEPGIDIFISGEAQGETVFIPACVSHGGVNDLVYNDFHVEAGADVIIVAGCGVHNDSHEESQHNGIHRFFLGKGAHVLYKEKHIGTGEGEGDRKINPVTD
ncbi:MAG: ABC transporter permease, partial [Firmicutes bacterium]|nr:ABC transporter permease [Bacillota bacterium]